MGLVIGEPRMLGFQQPHINMICISHFKMYYIIIFCMLKGDKPINLNKHSIYFMSKWIRN